MTERQFEDKFIAFVDVLGFKSMVERAEKGEGRTVAEILELLSILGNVRRRDTIRQYGPTTCPQSRRLRKDLALETTQVSDCVVVSAEVSPAGAINLVSHCWEAVCSLMARGVLVRGHITRGSVIHDGSLFMGTGYQDAYAREAQGTAFQIEADEKGTPFVEIAPGVVAYIEEHGDKCVQEMFSRMIERDGEIAALYPFRRFEHSFLIGGFGAPQFDPAEEKRQVDLVRRRIKGLIERLSDASSFDERAARKTRHYVAALQRQIELCDRTDKMIDRLSKPFGLPA